MPYALIFGSNLGTSGIVRRLQKEGFFCIVLGHDGTQVGATFADEYYCIDYHDIATIPPQVRNASFDLVVPGAHDLFLKAYYLFMSEAQGKLNKNCSVLGLEDYEALHNKVLFRKKLKVLAPMRTPPFVYLNEVTDVQKIKSSYFPLLFKPEHAGGGRGIESIKTREDLCEFLSARPWSKGLFEKYIDGIDISISMWLDEAQVIAWYGDREFSEIRPFHISGSLSNNRFLEYIRMSGIISELGLILEGFGIVNGFVHCQIRLHESSKWSIIEFTRRLPGDLYQKVPEWFGGFDYTHYYLNSFSSKRRQIAANFCFRNEQTFGRVCVPPGYYLNTGLVSLAAFNSHSEHSLGAYRLNLVQISSSLDLFSPHKLLTRALL